MIDLGEKNWQEHMASDPAFRVGDVYVFRSKGADYDGYTVAVYERYGEPPVGADICRKAIFWDKAQALSFAQLLEWKDGTQA